MSQPLVSIIVSSFDYDRYLREAIDSALCQTHRGVEVIVVDDGSADASPQIIRSYGTRVTAVLKDNGGQASAWNAGTALAHGSWIVFLDSDDRLLPHAAHAIAGAAARGRISISKIHWPIRLIGEHGAPLGAEIPGAALPSGSRLAELADFGFDRGPNLPSSANAWSADFLRQVMPMPEPPFRISADTWLLGLSPLFGDTAAVAACCSEYRCHARNNGVVGSERDRAAAVACRARLVFGRVSAELAYRGRPADPRRWMAANPEYRRVLRIAGGSHA